MSLLAGMLAGCASSGGPDVGPAPAGATVEGWVVDEALRPVPDVKVVAQGLPGVAAEGGDGHFVLHAPAGVDLFLTLQAPGFVPTTRFLPAHAGAHHWLNVTLERSPDAEPYVRVEEWRGFLQCAATLVLMEDPGRPHEHQGVRCDDALPEGLDRNVWRHQLPAGASGLVVEVVWEPGTPLSRSLVLKAEAEATGEVIGFLEGPSILRLQVAAFHLAKLAQSGDGAVRFTIMPGAGAGNHEHGAAGAFVEQPFTIYATSFFNQPADPNYSIAQA